MNKEIRLEVAVKVTLKYLLEQDYLSLDDVVTTNLLREPVKERENDSIAFEYLQHPKK